MYRRTRLLMTGMKCDFCADPHPVWVYAARRMSTGAPIECWRWAACAECARVITDADWATLKLRMVYSFLSVVTEDLPLPLLFEAIESSLQTFFEDELAI